MLITGDLNARTGEELDFTSTGGDSYITGTNLDFPILPNRNNYDKTQAGVENKSYRFAESWVCTLSMEGCEGTPLEGIRIVQTSAAALLIML